LRRTSHLSLAIAIAIALFATRATAQQSAYTKDNRKVLLYPDGTWSYAEQLKIAIQPTVLPAPPFQGAFRCTPKAVVRAKLVQVSAKKNQITDDEAWFRNHGLTLPTWQVPNPLRQIRGTCPPRTPASYNRHRLIQAIHTPRGAMLIYGRNFSEGRHLLITDREITKAHHLLDFRNYMRTPGDRPAEARFTTQSLHWAARVGDVLYVAHGHRTYAKSSRGLNAYITAIRLEDYSLLWRTKPLICNSRNFAIVDNIIVAGYGFTAEPDHLYAIDRRTGKLLDRKKLKTGPSFIIEKQGRLFVRTYNMDYVFRLD
jgi:hypothetical protein